MNPDPDHDLLDEILAETAPAKFRQTLLDATLRAARQRRRARHAGRGITIAAIAVMGVWACYPFLRVPAPNHQTVKTTAPRLKIIASQPLPNSAIVETKTTGLQQIKTSSRSFVLVETGAVKDPFQAINDDQLLAFSGGRPVALVRESDHAARLLFLDATPDEFSKEPRQ